MLADFWVGVIFTQKIKIGEKNRKVSKGQHINRVVFSHLKFKYLPHLSS